jgi:hypothetical protein
MLLFISTSISTSTSNSNSNSNSSPSHNPSDCWMIQNWVMWIVSFLSIHLGFIHLFQISINHSAKQSAWKENLRMKKAEFKRVLRSLTRWLDPDRAECEFRAFHIVDEVWGAQNGFGRIHIWDSRYLQYIDPSIFRPRAFWDDWQIGMKSAPEKFCLMNSQANNWSIDLTQLQIEWQRN